MACLLPVALTTENRVLPQTVEPSPLLLSKLGGIGTRGAVVDATFALR